MDNLDLSFILLSFSSLFALLNPIGIAPIILSITENYSLKDYKKLIRKSTIFACIILLIFAIMGKIIFSFYGITLHAFKIAGGILFLRIGLNMLEAKVSRTKSTPKESEEAETNNDIALSPIGIPLIAGPGAITSVMILSAQTVSFNQKIIFYLSIVLTLLITFIILTLAKKLTKILGTVGLRIIERIMGMILMVVAIQFIIDGMNIVIQIYAKNIIQ
jgi:multiple antibiotic resistance protein